MKKIAAFCIPNLGATQNCWGSEMQLPGQLQRRTFQVSVKSL